MQSREHTNFTYDLQRLNVEHLAWFVAQIAGVTVGDARGYLSEIQNDQALKAHVMRATLASDRRGLANTEVRFARRIGWYALTRALRPEIVVETGTDKGLGTVVLAAALLRNGRGRLTTIDINPEAGYLIAGPYSDVTTLSVGDSIEAITRLADPIDLFIHDSSHTPEHEAAEFDAIGSHLSWTAVALSDNSHVTSVLPQWAEATRRHFLFFAEKPAGQLVPR